MSSNLTGSRRWGVVVAVLLTILFLLAACATRRLEPFGEPSVPEVLRMEPTPERDVSDAGDSPSDNVREMPPPPPVSF